MTQVLDEPDASKTAHKDSPQVLPALKKAPVIPPILKDGSKSLSMEAMPDAKTVAPFEVEKKEAESDIEVNSNYSVVFTLLRCSIHILIFCLYLNPYQYYCIIHGLFTCSF